MKHHDQQAREESPILRKRKSVCAAIGVSAQTLWRYLNHPDYEHLNFPRPRYIGSIPYWSEEELREWADSLPSKPN